MDMTWVTDRIALGGGIWTDDKMIEVVRAGVTHIVDMQIEWEWCNDFYGVKYFRDSPGVNPRGPKQGEKRVLRGGAWSSSAGNCTSWVRNCDEAGLTDVCLTMDSNGFRCVRRK